MGEDGQRDGRSQMLNPDVGGVETPGASPLTSQTHHSKRLRVHFGRSLPDACFVFWAVLYKAPNVIFASPALRLSPGFARSGCILLILPFFLPPMRSQASVHNQGASGEGCT